jgi:hypothetical protein
LHSSELVWAASSARSTEQAATKVLFDSEVLKFFNDLGLQHQPWFLEGNQEWLLVWEHNNIVPPQLMGSPD